MNSSRIFSVIIPVYNDPDGIEQTLQSLVRQKNAPNYEIIVVDNDSTDETPRVIEKFEENYPKLVFGYSETEIQGSYAARNTGIEHASGDLLAFVDADVTVEDTWVADIHERFQNSDVDYLGCNVEMYIPDGENTFWAQYDVTMGLPVEHYLETKQFVPTCALVVCSEVFEQLNQFDESLVSGGDKEFGRRVNKTGLTMEYAGDIVTRHPARSTFCNHVKKATRIGKGQTQLWKRHDLASHPASPVKLFPPNPSRVKSRFKEETGIIFIYFTVWFFKMVQTTSSVRKLIQIRITNHNGN